MLAVFLISAVSPRTSLEIAVAIACLLPLLALGFLGDRIVSLVQRASLSIQLLLPCTLATAYLIIALSDGTFRARWLIVYIAVPVAVSLLLWFAKRIDPEQRGVWPDYAVLLILGRMPSPEASRDPSREFVHSNSQFELKTFEYPPLCFRDGWT